MEPEPLPAFRYYADPVRDGRVTRSDATCAACDRQRGWISSALLYSEDAPDGAEFCPWCIADGSAVARYGGSFNDLEEEIAADRREELSARTPNFETWQDWSWPTHCADAAIYLGQPTERELGENGAARAAVEACLADADWSEELRDEVIAGLGPESSVVAYLFRCTGCGELLARWDSD